MTADAHFAALLASLDDPTKALYEKCKHVRIETAYQGRQFIIYTMGDKGPVELERIKVVDFMCDNQDGATSEIASTRHGKLTLDYLPHKLFDFPILMWLPLHTKTRWSAPASDPFNGSLGFPVAIRTRSRFNLREEGITYCETGPAFGDEFGNDYGI